MMKPRMVGGFFISVYLRLNNIISSEENFKFLRPKDNIALNSLKQDEIVELALNEIDGIGPRCCITRFTTRQNCRF